VNPIWGASKYSKAKLLRIFWLFLFYNAHKSKLLTLVKQKKPAFRLAFEYFGGEGGIRTRDKL
jgi:hypothetical protein